MDDPREILDGAIDRHCRMINEMKGARSGCPLPSLSYNRLSQVSLVFFLIALLRLIPFVTALCRW